MVCRGEERVDKVSAYSQTRPRKRGKRDLIREAKETSIHKSQHTLDREAIETQ
jgi:hypothetical protein